MGSYIRCFVLVYLSFVFVASDGLEPKCSKFDFEEKLLEKMVRMEHKTEILTEKYDELLLEMNDMKAALLNFNRSLLEISENTRSELAAITHRSSVYAFSAYWITDTSPSVGHNLIFSRTLLDTDGVYNNKTGEFTAPTSGIYMFASNLCIHNGQSVRVEFVSAVSIFGRFRVSDDVYSECSSGTVIGHVENGSKVWVKVIEIEPGNVFHNDEKYTFNSFTGHLLQKTA